MDLQNFRSVSAVFREAVDQSLTLPATLGATTVSSLGAAGGNARLRLAYNVQNDYNSLWLIGYSQNSTSVTIAASAGWLTGTALTLDVPDLSGVMGWNTAWGLAPGASTNWFFSASGWTTSAPGVPQIEEGAISRSAGRTGSITP
jgi:hypothetical protein